MYNQEDIQEGVYTEKKALTVFNPENPRHPLLKNKKDDKYVQEMLEEISLDAELGLKGQAITDAKNFYFKDVDELIKTTDYVEVDNQVLESLFDIPKMKFYAFFKNTGRMINAFFNLKFYMSFLGLISSTLLMAIFFSIPDYNGIVSVFGMMSFIIGMVLVIVSIYLSILSLFSLFDNDSRSKPFSWEEIQVYLGSDEVKETKLRMPFSVKKKLKEAIDKRIFDEFRVFYPKIEEKTRNVEFPRLRNIHPSDPALVGISKASDEEKLYLITYWDIIKDREKSWSKLRKRKLKKLKVS